MSKFSEMPNREIGVATNVVRGYTDFLNFEYVCDVAVGFVFGAC